MKSFNNFLLLFLLLPVSVMAQQMKFGKYSQYELNLKQVDFDPEAVGVVLEEYSYNTFLSGIQNSMIHRRLKILKDEGKGKSDFFIRYYAENGIENITKLTAQSVTYVDGVETVTKLSKDDFIEVNLGNGLKEIRIAFRNVQKGTILEYSYTKSNKSIAFLDSWVFHNDWPTLKSTYSIELPSYLNYRFLAQGEKTRKADYKKNIGSYTWEVKDLLPIRGEPLVNNYRDYLEKIDFQLAGYLSQTSGFKDTYSTWKELTKFLVETEDFIHYLRPNNSLKSMLNAYVTNESNQMQKAKAIYTYVRDQYIHNGDYNYFPSKNLRTLIETKRGNSADINLTLIAYLKANGFNAYPLMISTKGNGRSVLVDTPFLDQFDQLIALVMIEDKEYYLDATSNELPFGYLLPYQHVYYGYLMKEEDSGLFPVKLTHKSGMVQMGNVHIEQGNILTEYTVRYSDYDAVQLKHMTDVAKADTLKKDLFYIKNANIEDLSIQQKQEPRLQVDLKYLQKDPISDGNLIFIQPLTNLRWAVNPLVSTSRTFPVDLLYPFTDNYSATIQIPEGYELDDYPEKVTINFPSGEAYFNYEITPFEQSVKISATLSFKKNIIYPDSYLDLKSFMEIMITKLQEPVVLKRTAQP